MLLNRMISLDNTFYFFRPASARSYKIGVIGNNCLVSWLVGNAVFSETSLMVFLIFCLKLGDHNGRKVTEPDFWKKFLIWRYSRRSLQTTPKSDTLIFFSKTALTIFLVFGLKLVLNMTFSLNETYFSEKFAILKSSGHFLDFAYLVFLDFTHNDRWAWCLVVFLQFADPFNVLLLFVEFIKQKQSKNANSEMCRRC